MSGTNSNPSSANSHTQDDVRNTIIVGGGPGGLIDVLYMLRRNQHVTLFEKRQDFNTRDNDVFLQQNLVKMLLQDFTDFYKCGYEIKYDFLPAKLTVKLHYNAKKDQRLTKTGKNSPKLSQVDLDFIEKIQQGTGTIRISEFQNFVRDKIDQYCAENDLKFDINNNEISGLNQDTSTVLFTDPHTNEIEGVSFDTLIIAEGANRKLTNKIFGANNEQLVTNPDTHPCAHGVCWIKLKDNVNAKELFPKLNATNALSNPFLPLSIDLKPADIAAFAQYGWKYNDLPNFYLKAEADTQHFYIACEIPKEWQQILDEIAKNNPAALPGAKQEINKLLNGWVKLILAKEYPTVDVNNLEIITTDPHKQPQTFIKAPSRLRTGYMQIKGKANVFVTGDALFSAVYKLGTGHYFAGIAGKAVADCYTDDGDFVSNKPFLNAQNKLMREYNFLLLTYNIVKIMENNPLKTRHIYQPLKTGTQKMYWMYRKRVSPSLREVYDIRNQEPNHSPTKPKAR